MMLKLKHVPEGIGNTRTVECLFRNTVDVEGERLCVLSWKSAMTQDLWNLNDLYHESQMPNTKL